jgi:hypothetical protein
VIRWTEPDRPLAQVKEDIAEEFNRKTHKAELASSIEAFQRSLNDVANLQQELRQCQRDVALNGPNVDLVDSLANQLRKCLAGRRSHVENLEAYRYEQTHPDPGVPEPNTRSLNFAARMLAENGASIVKAKIQLERCKQWLQHHTDITPSEQAASHSTLITSNEVKHSEPRTNAGMRASPPSDSLRNARTAKPGASHGKSPREDSNNDRVGSRRASKADGPEGGAAGAQVNAVQQDTSGYIPLDDLERDMAAMPRGPTTLPSLHSGPQNVEAAATGSMNDTSSPAEGSNSSRPRRYFRWSHKRSAPTSDGEQRPRRSKRIKRAQNEMSSELADYPEDEESPGDANGMDDRIREWYEDETLPDALNHYILRSAEENNIPWDPGMNMIKRLYDYFGNEYDWNNALPITAYLDDGGREKLGEPLRRLKDAEWSLFFRNLRRTPGFRLYGDDFRHLKERLDRVEADLNAPIWPTEEAPELYLEAFRERVVQAEAPRVRQAWDEYIEHVRDVSPEREHLAVQARDNMSRCAAVGDDLKWPPPIPEPILATADRPMPGQPHEDPERAAHEARLIGFEVDSLPGHWEFHSSLGAGGYGRELRLEQVLWRHHS